MLKAQCPKRPTPREMLFDTDYKLEFFKQNLVKALNRLVEVEKERDELRRQLEELWARITGGNDYDNGNRTRLD